MPQTLKDGHTVDARPTWSLGSRKREITSDLILDFKNPSGSDIAGLSAQDYYYNMQHPNRGVALIFSHKHFYQPVKCDTRYGTEVDRDALAKMFYKLKFDVRVYNDLGVSEIMDVLDEVSKLDHSQSDCLAVAIMSHGENGRIYASNGIYNTEKLWSYFTARNCPSLATKPKLFFIQACRGKNTDPGYQVDHDHDSPSTKQSNSSYSIPIMADILVMYATVEGYYAWRDTKLGSCFIQSLVKQLEAHHEKRDLLSILTLVNRQVALEFTSAHARSEFNGKKEMSSVVSMLTRLLQFNN